MTLAQLISGLQAAVAGGISGGMEVSRVHPAIPNATQVVVAEISDTAVIVSLVHTQAMADTMKLKAAKKKEKA